MVFNEERSIYILRYKFKIYYGLEVGGQGGQGFLPPQLLPPPPPFFKSFGKLALLHVLLDYYYSA